MTGTFARLCTGWFGVPGDFSGDKSTKVHIVDMEKKQPACGSMVGDDQEFQYCAVGVYEEFLECGHCIAAAKKLRKS